MVPTYGAGVGVRIPLGDTDNKFISLPFAPHPILSKTMRGPCVYWTSRKTISHGDILEKQKQPWNILLAQNATQRPPLLNLV